MTTPHRRKPKSNRQEQPQPSNGEPRPESAAARPGRRRGGAGGRDRGRTGEQARPAGERPSCLPPHGRLASMFDAAELSWFVPGWFARSMLSVLIGRKNVGKSSCLAWLLAQAQRPVILPGYEESVELMMLPRWRAHKVLLRSLLVLNDQRYLPSLQLQLLMSILTQHHADLLVIEGLDSYLPPDASTNDSQAVRPFLESLQAIAQQSGAAIVGTRHPGKDLTNLCPGSHEWEDVPRISVILEREGPRSATHYMISHRCGVGQQPAPMSYTLVRDGASPPVFTPTTAATSQALEIAQQAPDLIDRQRLQAALDLLGVLLSGDWIEAKTIFAEANKEALGEGTVRRAAAILEVQMRREGNGLNHKSLWGRKDLAVPPAPKKP
jgi:AAA domain